MDVLAEITKEGLNLTTECVSVEPAEKIKKVNTGIVPRSSLAAFLQDNNDDEIVEAGSQNGEDAIKKVELYYFDCQSFDPLKM